MLSLSSLYVLKTGSFSSTAGIERYPMQSFPSTSTTGICFLISSTAGTLLSAPCEDCSFSRCSITLSTCAYVNGVDGARFVVMGRLLREGESAAGCYAVDNPGALDIRQNYRP